jgi:hypothetical protein
MGEKVDSRLIQYQTNELYEKAYMNLYQRSKFTYWGDPIINTGKGLTVQYKRDFFFAGTQGQMFAKQVLYYLNHAFQP